MQRVLHKCGLKQASHMCLIWISFSRLYVGEPPPTFQAVCLVPSLWSHPSCGWHLSGRPRTGRTLVCLYAFYRIDKGHQNAAQLAQSGSRTHSHNAPTQTPFPAQSTTLLVAWNMMTPCMWCPRILQVTGIPGTSARVFGRGQTYINIQSADKDDGSI